MSERTRPGRMDSVMEVLIATVLSVGGLMTSWASYQAALWDGEQAAHYSHANALRVMASRVRLEADERRGLQMMLFNSWLQAKARDDATLAAFYERRFPPDMRPAVNAWLLLHPLKDPTAPPSPFAMPAYRPDGMAEATRLEGEADATFEHGQSDNRISDLFTQGAVYMATAMFFGGIGQVFRMRSVRVGLLAVAIVACAIGLSRIVSLPLLKPG